MRIRNQSQYPTEEVRKLIEFAMKGINTTGVMVHVKNGHRGAVGGLAYYGVPSMSPAAKMKTVQQLITLRIGSPKMFPADNMVTTDRTTKWSLKILNKDWNQEEVDQTSPGPDWRIHFIHWTGSTGSTRDPDGYTQYRWERTLRHPYGGVSSPLIQYADWREGLVALAAHEARHVFQHRHHKKGKGEVDAEKFAAKRLAAYRAMQSPALKAAR